MIASVSTQIVPTENMTLNGAKITGELNYEKQNYTYEYFKICYYKCGSFFSFWEQNTAGRS